MRSLFIATASALLFAAVITELFTRLWPGEYVALLVLAFIALLVSGLLNLRLAGWPRTPPETAAQSGAVAPPRTPRQERRPAERARRPERAAVERSGRPTGSDKPADAAVRRETPRSAVDSDLPRETGTVKWFNRTKGFGFIIRTSGEEIFVHQRSIRFTGEGDNRRRPVLRDGQAVSFVVAEREKGLQAEDVVPED